jgi:Xaa-Pro aminopeptidase
MKRRDVVLDRAPATLSGAELEAKIAHLGVTLDAAKAGGILLTQEGSMRWLTGVRHQIGDIAPGAASPVQALVRRREDATEILFVSTPFEMPRIRDQLPGVFEGLRGVSISFAVALPALPADVLVPSSPAWAEVTGRIVRPLVGGFSGNQYSKLSWLASAATAVLAQSAREIEPGMNGAEVRARSLANLLSHDIDCNLLLVALPGQEAHLHPLWEARYKVEKDCWVKLVTGARLADMIISATVMVKFGAKPSAEALASYHALQEGTLEYADCYRSGATESEMYTELGRRFEVLEKKHGIPGFAASAYVHHLGGPTSPLGNRDYIIEKGGTRRMFPWMQFAINPVETRFLTKVEVQGVVQPDGPPHMLDITRFTPAGLLGFRDVVSMNGTKARMAEILVR